MVTSPSSCDRQPGQEQRGDLEILSTTDASARRPSAGSTALARSADARDYRPLARAASADDRLHARRRASTSLRARCRLPDAEAAAAACRARATPSSPSRPAPSAGSRSWRPGSRLAGPPSAAARAGADPGVRRLARIAAPAASRPIPAEVTDQMVANFAAGGAAINQLARLAGAELRVVPVGPGRPTARLHAAAGDERGRAARARSRRAARRSSRRPRPAGVGEMGIANTTAAAAVAAALLGERRRAAGPGPAPASTREGVARKAAVIDAGAGAASRPAHDAIRSRCLRHVGGRELAAMLGAILARAAARACRCCSTASSPPCRRRSLQALRSRRRRPLPVGHCSAEPGHRRLLERSGCRRCSTSACAWARPRVRRSRSSSPAPPSPATPAWRPSLARRQPEATEADEVPGTPGGGG